jgi:hypothetical protein
LKEVSYLEFVLGRVIENVKGDFVSNSLPMQKFVGDKSRKNQVQPIAEVGRHEAT